MKKTGKNLEKGVACFLLSWYNVIAKTNTLKARILYHNDRQKSSIYANKFKNKNRR